MKKEILFVKSLFFILLYCIPDVLFSQWKAVNWSRGIQDFEMLSSTLGYYTAGGLLCKTLDGGETWLVLGEFGIYALDFTDSNTGWVVGTKDYTGFVWKTTDGGATWQVQNIPGTTFFTTDNVLTDIVMNSPDEGWITGENGLLFHTVNGGETWSPVPLGAIAKLNAIYFSNPNLGWVGGDDEQLYKTSDAGVTWTKKSLGSPFNDDDLTSIHFSSLQKGWITDYFPGDVYKTLDGGDTWEKANLNQYFSYFKSAYFLDDNHGWLCGSDASASQGRLLNTTDGGLTWTLTNLNLADQIKLMFFWDDNLGWGVGGYDPVYSSIIKTTNGGTTWEEKKSIRNAYFTAVANAGNGTWYAAHSDEIYKSVDNGETWSQYAITGWHSPEALDFVNPNVGWLVLYDNKLLKTTDGFTTWEEQSTPDDNTGFLTACSFVDENTGWVVGYPNKVLKTTNGGDTWTAQTTPPNPNLDVLFDVFFINASTGWAVGEYGIVLRTTNGGSTWKMSQLDYNLNAVYFVNPTTGWAVGDLGTIKKTTNGGITWVAQSSPVDANLNSIYFADENHGWISGFKFNGGSVILVTDNGGQTWNLSNGHCPIIQSMDGDPSGYIVLVGDDGLIMKNMVPFSVGLKDVANVENGIENLSVYPNPFTDVIYLRINWDIGNLDIPCEVTVSNIFGQVILQHNSQTRRTLQIDGSHWHAGIYFLQISILGQSIKSRVLIKY